MYKKVHDAKKITSYTTSSIKQDTISSTKVSSYNEVVRAASGGGASGGGGATIVAY